MSTVITRIELRYEQDVVYARQRTRLIAELLGFDRSDQTRLSTAVSEIARNAFQYAQGGEVQYTVESTTPPQALCITVTDHGPGIKNVDDILAGRFTSRTGMGLGLVGARRLVDHFDLKTEPGQGATIRLGKNIPKTAPAVTPQVLAHVTHVLVQTKPETPLEEIRLQNHELMRALEELRLRQQELLQLNQELEDTNRGVLALYAELDDKAAQLARANELKARFLSNMSHEFRTPLNSTLALTRLLLDHVDGDLTQEQDKQVMFIRKATEDLSTLVNDLLDLAKIEAGKTSVYPRECLVADIFSGLRGMLRPMVAAENLVLVFEEPQGIPPLFTDEGKVSQILRNLLSNAFKFTEQGEIRVSARLSADGLAVVFSVADTGIGIAPENQARIFEEYAQVEVNAQTGKIKGTGLGLSISKKLAQMLGGSVGVESRLGAGSTFFATIPLQYVTPAEAVAAAPPAVDITRHPVLVVEDDQATQFLYDKYLKGTGFQAVPALSIAMARQILNQFTPAAIVLDILLPGEDAWGFLAAVKSAPATRNIPVIIASVLQEQDKGLALGAEDYCIKPMERKWLLNKLKTLAQQMPIDKLLIVDDEEVARYILKGHLADTRFTALEAANGQQALSMAESEHPDVIFLDLMMPGMSGFDVLHRLKTNPVTQHIPVIINTSKILDEAELQALNTSALAILHKEAPSREAAIESVMQALRKAVQKTQKEEPNGGTH